MLTNLLNIKQLPMLWYPFTLGNTFDFVHIFKAEKEEEISFFRRLLSAIFYLLILAAIGGAA